VPDVIRLRLKGVIVGVELFTKVSPPNASFSSARHKGAKILRHKLGLPLLLKVGGASLSRYGHGINSRNSFAGGKIAAGE
jgi:hypothetical protein